MPVKTIRAGDDDFVFLSDDRMTIFSRAGFEILDQCPKQHKSLILEAYSNGWLRPIAHIPVHEHFMEKLTK